MTERWRRWSTYRWLRRRDPWVALQRLTYPEREALMERLAEQDPRRASALVARVLTELAAPCSTIVFDECSVDYDEGWRQEFPDSSTLGAHACVATRFVDDYADLLIAYDLVAVADDLDAC